MNSEMPKPIKNEQRRHGEGLRFTLNIAGIGEWGIHRKTGEVWHSLRHDQIFGYDKPVAQWSYSIFLNQHVHPDDRAYVDNAFKNTEMVEVECRILLPDKTERWIWIKGAVNPDVSSKSDVMTGIIQDITQRKQSEISLTQLTEESGRLRRIYETVISNTPDFMYVFDRNGRCIYANESLLTMWGVDAKGAIGKSFLEIGYEPWHADMHNREIRQVIATRQPLRGEVPFNGTYGYRIYDYIFVPVFGANGEVEAIAGTTRDVTERKQMEETLRLSQERLTMALESSSFVGTWDWDVIKNLVVADARFASIYGVDPEWAAKGAPIEEFVAAIHPDDIDTVQAAIKSTIEHGGDFSQEYRLAQKDGSVVWVLARGHAYKDAEGKVVRFAGAAANITAERKASDALRASERQFRQIANALPQIIWTARPDGHLNYVSDQYYSYSGMPREETDTINWTPVIHPDDLANTTRIWLHSIATGEPYEVHQRIFHHPTQAYRWNLTRALPIRNDEGTITSWLGTNTDVEEQRNASDSLREVKDHLQLMVESAKDFVIISMNLKGEVISWNQGAERIFGYAPEEVIGKLCSIIFTPEDRANHVPEKELATAARMGRADDERWHIRKNGERFYASGIMAAMYNNNGELQGFTKIARDMTAQKNAEEMLIEARNAAEAANIAKTEFLANMSHEIRTPMNAVIGLSNILSVSQPLTPKQKEYIKTLQMSADALLALINDLLDIAKIEARTVDLEQIPFCITQLVQEVISMMTVRMREKGLQFTLDGECVKSRKFMGDPTRFRQIVLNLCSNAIKFTEHGSVHIAITCHPTNDPAIENICVSVKDTGIGIEPDKLETIFHKFVQADTSINRKYGGTGLGLAITKTLTEIMGGTISVSSKVGEGSTFAVCIPLPIVVQANIVNENGSLPVQIQDTKQVRRKPRILLVEDYQPNVMVASTFLEKFGYECDVATNGMEAIDKVKNNSYQAVLMDVQMHDMNGLEATRLIREYEKQRNIPHLPIIGMTAHAMAGDKERCLGVGMNDYISKPFNPDELRAKIEKLL